MPLVAEAVREADAELRDTLTGGSPRNAIVACWVRLEATVGRAGVPRRPAETSIELTTRVVAEHMVDAAAIDRLGELYREARFSAHELGESHRLTAIASLAELQNQLGDGALDGVDIGVVTR